MGIKPLYYGWQQGVFLFGSELKALKAHPSWQGEVDRGALALFLKNGFIPAPWSIYQGIFKLPAGTVLTLNQGGPPRPLPRPFWSLRADHGAGPRGAFPGRPGPGRH